MALKVFKGLWLMSFIAMFGALMYVYAGLPQDVVIQYDEQNNPTLVSKEAVFYGTLLLSLVINVLVYLIRKMFAHEEAFRAWFHGLIITLNLFIILTLLLLGTFNSAEKFDFSEIGFLIYGSVGLIIVWALSWPLYILFIKISPKQKVL